MIDSIRIAIPTSSLSTTVIPHLQSISEHVGIRMCGQLSMEDRQYQNWHITIKNNEIVLAGSLENSISGTNQQSVTLDECRTKLHRLGCELQLPIFEGRIRRLDIAFNLIVQHPVVSYLLLMNSGKLTSNSKKYRAGAEFGNTQRQLCLYDKIKEQKSKSVSIDPILRDRHVLRYEKRFLKNSVISSCIGVKDATVEDTFASFSKIIRAWAVHYHGINKKTSLQTFRSELFTSPKKLRDYLMKKGMEAMGGYSAIEDLIKDANVNGVFKYPSEMSNLKTKLRQIAALDNQQVKLNYINELDGKVNEAEKFAYFQALTWYSFN